MKRSQSFQIVCCHLDGVSGTRFQPHDGDYSVHYSGESDSTGVTIGPARGIEYAVIQYFSMLVLTSGRGPGYCEREHSSGNFVQ